MTRKLLRSLVFIFGLAVHSDSFAALAYSCGSFTKSTGAAPAAQSVAHGLGSTPKVLIMWMASGLTTDSFVTSFLAAFGASTGATNSYSIAAASLDAGASSDASRRMFNKALTIVQWGETLLAEADLTSFDGTNFNLNWTTNNLVAYLIHFCVIGGNDLTNVNVLNWESTAGTGNKSITGMGFQPDLVIHFQATRGTLTSVAGAEFTLGAMTSVAQWAAAIRVDDNVTTTDTYRIQQTDSAMVRIDGTGAVNWEFSYVSMDSDGFTINDTTSPGAGEEMFSLGLKGGSYTVGASNKPTGAAPVTQTFTTTFTPRGYLLASFQDITRAASVAHARLGIGGSDGTNEQASSFQDTDNLADSSVDAIDSTTKVFVKVNNNTPTIDAEADHSSLGATGPVISWSTNDAVATEMLFVAFGDAVAGGCTGSRLALMGVGGC